MHDKPLDAASMYFSVTIMSKMRYIDRVIFMGLPGGAWSNHSAIGILDDAGDRNQVLEHCCWSSCRASGQLDNSVSTDGAQSVAKRTHCWSVHVCRRRIVPNDLELAIPLISVCKLSGHVVNSVVIGPSRLAACNPAWARA